MHCQVTYYNNETGMRDPCELDLLFSRPVDSAAHLANKMHIRWSGAYFIC